MAEDNARKNESWVVEQARREVEAAQARVKNAPGDVNAKADLKAAEERLRGLLRTSRRDRRVDLRLKAAQSELEAAQKTADPADDAEAQARVDRLTGKAETTESKKTETESKADAYFLSQMGPMVVDAVKEFPELREFFRQAIAGQWTDVKQQRELNNPDQPWFKFWRAKGTYWRTGFALQFGPNATEGTWGEKLKESERLIQAAAKDAGVVLSPEQLASLSRRYWYSEWQNNADALTSWMQQRATNPNQELVKNEDGTTQNAPTLDATISDLKDLAESYGLSLPPNVLQDWARKIIDPLVNTNKSEDAKFLQYLVTTSRSTYAPFADQIDENTNLRQLTGPYTTALARLLEMNPADLKMTDADMDPLLKRALTNVNRDSGKPERVPLWEFEQMVRADDRWQLTDNARQTYMNAGQGFLRSLGFVG